MKIMMHTINAQGKVLGRLAGEAAVLLRGKNNAAFDPARFTPRDIVIYNTDYVRTTGQKRSQKIYYRHSGFIGRLKQETMGERMRRDSRLLVRDAVYGMLPKNRLRDRLMKHLHLEKGALSD